MICSPKTIPRPALSQEIDLLDSRKLSLIAGSQGQIRIDRRFHHALSATDTRRRIDRVFLSQKMA